MIYTRRLSASYPTHGVWWLHPTCICLLFLLPMYLLIWVVAWNTNGELSSSKAMFFFKGEVAWLGLAGILILSVGTMSPVKPAKDTAIFHDLNRTVLRVLGVLALIGYLYWFKDLIIRPRQMLELILNSTSLTYAIRGNIERGAGLASLAQLGIPYIIGYYYINQTNHKNSLLTYDKFIFATILSLIVFRAFAWGERLAIIETGIALSLMWATFSTRKFGAKIPTSIHLLPITGAVFVLLLFAAGEYFRSWSSHYVNQGSSFWLFIIQRFANYYFDALNTGAGRLSVYDWPTFEFAWTLSWVHKLPVFGPYFSALVDARGDDFLTKYGDPEFNNPSGLFSIFLDVGVFWGFVVFLVLGFLAKYTYSYWRIGTSFFGAFYYLFLMLFMELFRYFYLGDARCFMVVVGLTILLVTSKKQKSRPVTSVLTNTTLHTKEMLKT